MTHPREGRKVAAWLAAASFAAHLGYAALPAARAGRMPMDEGIYRELGEHLAATGRLYLDGDAFNTVAAGAPTLFWTPGYPLLLAAVAKSGLPFLGALWAIQALLIAALPLLLRPLAARLLEGRRLTAFLALIAFYPYHFPLALQVGSEAMAAFLAAACLGLAAAGRPGPSHIAGTGALGAALALTRPEYLAFAAAVGAWWVLRGFSARAAGASPGPGAAAATYVLAFAALVGPWMLRNHGVTGKWIFTTRSGYSLVFQNEWYDVRSRDRTADQAAWWGALPAFPGEADNYAYLKARGRAFIRAHPGTYARMGAKRAASLILPQGAKRALARAVGRDEGYVPALPAWHRFSNGVFLLLAWSGGVYAVWSRRGRWPGPVWGSQAGLLAAVVAAQAGVFVSLAYIEYQRSLLDPEILLLAAWACRPRSGTAMEAVRKS